MLEFLSKLFSEQLTLSADLWLILLTAVVLVAFLIPLIVGLVAGSFNKIKTNMKGAVKQPKAVVVKMKNMPASVKNLYKNARLGNAKPSSFVTQAVCVDTPYKHSLISKVWLIALIATLICAPLGGLVGLVSDVKTEADVALAASSVFLSPIFLYIIGGLLTLIGGIVGKAVYGGAVKTYAAFAPVMDGNQQGGAAAVHSEPQAAEQPVYAAGNTYEPQAAYAEQPAYNAEPQNTYEPQSTYESQSTYEPQSAYEPQAESYAQPVYGEQQAEPYVQNEEPAAVVADAPQESDEEIRRRAREEAMAQARAQQQAAQAQAQAQAQAAAQAQTTAPQGGTSADDVIAQIEKISREGAPRETMREVATLLQKERAKPENKTPEQQKRLNEALSKLLKAMSAASRK